MRYLLVKAHVKAHTRRTKSGGAAQVSEHEDKRGEVGYGRKEIDHTVYQRKVRTMTDESLRFVIKDATEAIQANPDGHKAGYYLDEIHYCAAELRRRAGKK